MNPQTFIFIGKSGCGKGTQADNLKKFLAAKGSFPSFYIETGQRFREFIADSGYTNELSRAVMTQGIRQPDFLAVWIWASVLVENARGKEHWILDGLPRSALEARVLDTAMKFYGRARPHVIYLNVSHDAATERLTKRGRADDRSHDDIAKRLAWYESEVKPAVDHYRAHPDYQFLEIDGEKTIEGVWTEIVSKLSL